MTDIQQWRRRIQPARARTPAYDLDDADDMASPSTPKQCLKSKVSSYFDFRQHSKTASFNDDLEPQHLEPSLPTWPTDQLYPDPDAEEEMDSVMCSLMSDPYVPLDVRFNGSLMRIFEQYMSLKGEKEQLQRRIDQEVASSQAILSKLNMAEKDWEDEKRDYKDEVKRLEILLSRTSKRGVAEVTLARQDSKLRRERNSSEDNKETIFEFLDKMNRHDERFYNSQRATMKPLLPLPSDKDNRLSQKLAQKKSITNILADLPFGTPPDRDMRFSLTHISKLEQEHSQKTRARAVTTSTDTSGDTFSAFSCENALPPNDTTNAEASASGAESNIDSDLAEITRLAAIVAQRRNIDSAQVMPQLLNLFKVRRGNRADSADTMSSILGPLGIAAPLPPRPTAPTRAASVAENAPVKRKTVMSKASGLFSKFKSQQLTVAASIDSDVNQRRFSFEPGDDAAVQTLKPGGIIPGIQDRRLRKSVSLDILTQTAQGRTVMDPMLSPVLASPTTSVAADRPSSRIPTPVFSSGSLAKPRQDREDSSSSLLTAIKLAGDPSKRSSSLCSSVYSSPSASREELGKSAQSEASPLVEGTLSSSNRLVDHTKALRGSSVLSPTARAASAGAEAAYDARTPGNKAGARSILSAYSNKPDMSDPRRENSRPMGSGPRTNDPSS